MRETEPTGQTMFPSTAASKNSAKGAERRSFPREKLKRYVVLVYFGEDNWGKLTNMSESGMAFEFAKPPSPRERVNFTFQAMGCMPMPRNGKALGDSFEASGEIVWTREFERGAGVHFVNMAEASREQIRQWLSFETSPNTSAHAEQVKSDLQPILAEVLAPLGPRSNTGIAPGKKESLLEFDMPVPIAEPVREPDSAFLESSVAEEPYEAPGRSDQEETANRSRGPESHSSVARLTFLVVSGCLAAFAVTAGVRIFTTRAAHQVDAAVPTPDRAPGIDESRAAVNVSSPDPAPVTSLSATSAPPFQVDVLGANGRSWILWFVHGGAKNKDSQLPERGAESSNSPAATVTIAKREEAAPQPRQEARTFAMVAPNRPNSDAQGKPSAEAPTIQPELTPSSGDPFGGGLGHQMAPAAPVVHAPTGGMVQQPRLIRATLPVYPQLAKSSRVGGDVVVDALIDAAGHVTTVKVISGPVLLQQAAIETVRHWTYEPARLDGQAVAMHLSVTVRFRLN